MKNAYRIVVLIMVITILITAFYAMPLSAQEMTFKPTVMGEYIYGIPEKTTFDMLAEVLPKTIIDISRLDGTSVTSGSSTYIGTGFLVTLNGNSYTVVILGDINGDGIIKANDYLILKRHYLGTYTITGDANLLAAGDENLDGNIKAVKYLMVKRHVLGSYDMNVNYTVPYTTPPDDESGWTNSWV